MASQHGEEPRGPLALSVGHLERLAGEFRAAGWRTTLTISRDRWPYLHVVNPRFRALNDDVIAAPDAAGRWWFWWSWAERIAPVADLGPVAARVGRVLAAGSEQ